MFNWNAFAEKIRDSFARLMSLEGGGLHWIALSGAVAIALLVYLLRRDKAEFNGLRGFIRFCFPAQVYSSASSKLDFKYLVVNTLIYGSHCADGVDFRRRRLRDRQHFGQNIRHPRNAIDTECFHRGRGDRNDRAGG